ncbi:hypothetical protein, partial [Janthinobacterium sp.]|uniref:hypothetical protein n=1 Tax=Janthinobacterium sp. TaxID=1871054 RepID=UPI00293D6839
AVTGRFSAGAPGAAPLLLDPAGARGGRIVFNPGDGVAVPVPSGPVRRLSWREVSNWRELHEAAKP